MGINERKEKDKEIRRHDIIEAAERVFFSKGYNIATMDDVAKEAEFSKRTVYVYFNSKEQIYFEIMIRGYRLLLAMMQEDQQALEEGNAIDILKQMGKTIYCFSKVHPEYLNAITQYENGEIDFEKGITDSSREECYALGEKMTEYLTGALRQGIEEGIIRSELNVVKTALVLWACMVGVLNMAKKKKLYIKNYHQTTPDELIAAAFELMIESIQTDKGANEK